VFHERGHVDPFSFVEICETAGIEFAGLYKETGITRQKVEPSPAADHGTVGG
jgi:hypothetical protein